MTTPKIVDEWLDWYRASPRWYFWALFNSCLNIWRYRNGR